MKSILVTKCCVVVVQFHNNTLRDICITKVVGNIIPWVNKKGSSKQFGIDSRLRHAVHSICYIKQNIGCKKKFHGFMSINMFIYFFIIING